MSAVDDADKKVAYFLHALSPSGSKTTESFEHLRVLQKLIHQLHILARERGDIFSRAGLCDECLAHYETNLHGKQKQKLPWQKHDHVGSFKAKLLLEVRQILVFVVQFAL
jgi:hypothetical protein